MTYRSARRDCERWRRQPPTRTQVHPTQLRPRRPCSQLERTLMAATSWKKPSICLSAPPAAAGGGGDGGAPASRSPRDAPPLAPPCDQKTHGARGKGHGGRVRWWSTRPPANRQQHDMTSALTCKGWSREGCPTIHQGSKVAAAAAAAAAAAVAAARHPHPSLPRRVLTTTVPSRSFMAAAGPWHARLSTPREHLTGAIQRRQGRTAQPTDEL